MNLDRTGRRGRQRRLRRTRTRTRMPWAFEYEYEYEYEKDRRDSVPPRRVPLHPCGPSDERT
ncbi:MAG: hypothetical protein HZA54_11860 [Planctomycetes bacterium]|nr:hypothetical protein [Planctomycetota bacterium]